MMSLRVRPKLKKLMTFIDNLPSRPRSRFHPTTQISDIRESTPLEAEFIDWLRSRLAADPRVPIGIGSDAAVLRLASSRAVVTTDALMDGVDFILSEVAPRRVGWKALAVNLSDLAAMGAKPVAAFISLILPRDNALSLAQELYEGLFPLADRFQVAIAGGDTNCWNGPLAISITAIGEPPANGCWTRHGARPGDVILASGSFGGSILGKHLDFTPRLELAQQLAERYKIRAATDVSDGLSLDLSHILSESGVGACLELDAIMIADAAHELSRSRPDGLTPLDHALSDGEDFELLLVATPAEAARIMADTDLAAPIRPIGFITAELGLCGRQVGQLPAPLIIRGYQH
jgi:thiamine-monophosphate kinase